MVKDLIFQRYNFASVKFKNKKMKSVLITGANKGIGLETAKQLLKKGLFVYVGSRDIKKRESNRKRIKHQWL